MRKKKLLFAVAMWILSAPVLACIEASALQKLAESEMGYMLQRIPPAFADAVADGQIQGSMQIQSAEACQLHWQLTLPTADIEEAQAILQAQPAKQIMLAAQGYAIPAQTSLDVLFLLDEKRMQPQPKEALQTAPLGKLRASVELMYALLTQARADDAGSHPAWTVPETQALMHTVQNSSWLKRIFSKPVLVARKQFQPVLLRGRYATTSIFRAIPTPLRAVMAMASSNSINGCNKAAA